MTAGGCLPLVEVTAGVADAPGLDMCIACIPVTGAAAAEAVPASDAVFLDLLTGGREVVLLGCESSDLVLRPIPDVLVAWLPKFVPLLLEGCTLGPVLGRTGWLGVLDMLTT